MRQTFWRHWVVLSSLCIVACGDTETRGSVTMGFLFPYTNPIVGVAAPVMEAGVRVAQDLINKAGGVHGVPLAVKVYDGGANPNTFFAQLDQAINVDHVAFVVGARWDAADPAIAAQLATMTHQARVVFCDLNAASPYTNTLPDRDFLFTASSVNSLTSVFNAYGKDLVAKGVTKWVFAAQEPFDASSDPLTPAWRQYDPNATTVYVTYPALSDYSTWDPTATVQQIESSGANGVLYFGGVTDTVAIASKLASDGLVHPVSYLTGSSFAAVSSLPAGQREGFRMITALIPDPSGNLPAFVAALEAWNNGTGISDPSQQQLAAQAFDMAIWPSLALVKAGGQSGVPHATAMPQIFDPNGTLIDTTAMPQAFTALETGTISYRTALSGPGSLDSYHDRELRIAVFASDAAGQMSPTHIYPPGEP